MVDTLRFAVFLTFVAISLASKQGVPLFMWSNNKLDVPPPTSGHTVTRDEFNKGYLGSLLGSKQNIVAFVQDQLSVDDITQHADVYNDNSDGAALHNLKGLLEEHSSTQLPSVKNVPDILKKLKREFSGKVHELTHPYDIGNLPLDESANLIIAKLPAVGNSHGQRASQLRSNDGIMKSVSDDLKSMGKPFTALFTAEKPSQPSRNAVYTGRHLLQDGDSGDVPPGASFFNVSGYLYFFTSSIEITVVKNDREKPGYTRYILPASQDFDKSGSQAGNDSGTLILKYTGVKPNTTGVEGPIDVTLTFIFEIGKGQIWNGFWKISEFNITYSGGNDTAKLDGDNKALKGYDIYAPYSPFYSFCYHCTNTAPYIQSDRKDATKVPYYVQVKFIDLQVQFATEKIPMKDGQFGRPNDCTGFFTIPILSGLFAGLILILVLFYGISMIASITTMDRFDDPKGKAITVNVSE